MFLLNNRERKKGKLFSPFFLLNREFLPHLVKRVKKMWLLRLAATILLVVVILCLGGESWIFDTAKWLEPADLSGFGRLTETSKPKKSHEVTSSNSNNNNTKEKKKLLLKTYFAVSVFS